MNLTKSRQQLLRLLKDKAYRYRANPPFTLASGRLSSYYLDCRPVTHNAYGLTLVGEIFFNLIKELEVQAVGGLTMGADPIAHAVAVISYLRGKPINAFSIRKTPKAHGMGQLVEGDVRPGEKVVIVEDVMTTGGSVIKAIQAARDFGLHIVKVIILVDRQEGGREEVAKWSPQVEAVFTLQDFLT